MELENAVPFPFDEIFQMLGSEWEGETADADCQLCPSVYGMTLI